MLKVSLTKTVKPTRNRIDSHDDIRHWSKRWGVEPLDIHAAIEKAGNSVAAVQKELSLRGLIDAKPDKPADESDTQGSSRSR
jgi:hypothetical protein